MSPDNVDESKRERLSSSQAFSELAHVEADQRKKRRKKRPPQTPSHTLLESNSNPGGVGPSTKVNNEPENEQLSSIEARREALSPGQHHFERNARIDHHNAHTPPTPYFNYHAASHLKGSAAYQSHYFDPHFRYLAGNPWSEDIPEEPVVTHHNFTPFWEIHSRERQSDSRNQKFSFYHQGLRDAASAPTLIPATHVHMLSQTQELPQHQQTD
jgi:hypothetical protein